jgi:hypothetical protein
VFTQSGQAQHDHSAHDQRDAERTQRGDRLGQDEHADERGADRAAARRFHRIRRVQAFQERRDRQSPTLS